MRIDPLPKQTPVTITQQPDGYAATLTNVVLDDGSRPTTKIYPTITDAINAAIELGKQHNYQVI